MGSRAPSIHRIEVNSVGLDDDKQHMESVDLNLDIEYSGGLGIAIDVALAYGKSAFLSVKGTINVSQAVWQDLYQHVPSSLQWLT